MCKLTDRAGTQRLTCSPDDARTSDEIRHVVLRRRLRVSVTGLVEDVLQGLRYEGQNARVRGREATHLRVSRHKDVRLIVARKC